MTPRAERCTFHTLAGAWRGQDQEHPRGDHVSRQVLLDDQVLALPGLAEDDRDPVHRCPGLDPAGEPARHPHQVRVIELVLAAIVQPPPPAPEPARVMPDREEGIEHHPVHAVPSYPSTGPRSAQRSHRQASEFNGSVALSVVTLRRLTREGCGDEGGGSRRVRTSAASSFSSWC